MSGHSGLGWARVFAKVARELEVAQSTEERLRKIAELATEVTGSSWSAIARATDRAPVVAAAGAADVGEVIARIQAAGGDGPTGEAVRSGTTVYVPDLSAETRWPEHVRELLERTPVRSVLAFHLQLDRAAPLGTLTLYSSTRHAFPPPVCAVAAVYAGHAAVALDHDSEQARADNLELALASNREIGIAIGILVERYKITPEQGFDMLRAASQHTHRKLREIASDIVLTGELDLAS